MTIFDDGMREGFPEYDFGIIEQRVAEIQPKERFSQAREANKLTPVIRAIVAAHPGATAAAIADMFTAAREDGGEQLGPTFHREVGTIVRTIKANAKNGPVGAKTVTVATRGSRRRLATQQNDPVVSPARTQPTPDVVPSSAISSSSQAIEPPMPPVSAAGRSVSLPPPPEPSGHLPYHFSGKFAGRVFVHGPEIRAFFSAVDKSLTLAEIATLVAPVLASPSARAKLVELAPADKAIFDAMAAWAKAHEV